MFLKSISSHQPIINNMGLSENMLNYTHSSKKDW